METNSTLQQFFTFLDRTGFSEERKAYWLQKLGSNESSPEDEQAFTAELERHLASLDNAVEITEAEITADEAKKAELEAKALPSLRKLEAELPEFLKTEQAGYAREMSAAENGMMSQMEGVRGERQSAEIDAIRKKLLHKGNPQFYKK